MICVCLSEPDFQKYYTLSRKYDLVELRLDLSEFGVEEVRKIFSKEIKLIATYRPGQISEEERKKILIEAVKSGASYVDVEFESDYAFKRDIISVAREKACDVIVSYHNYQETPSSEQLKIIVEQCFSMGADIAKLACMVTKPEDNASLLSVYESGKRIVAVGMGELGKITRLAAPFLGAEFTLASPYDGNQTAPGQINYDNLISIIDKLKNS